jgi:hypothetical protein
MSGHANENRSGIRPEYSCSDKSKNAGGLYAERHKTKITGVGVGHRAPGTLAELLDLLHIS